MFHYVKKVMEMTKVSELSKIMKEIPKPVGRWRLEDCNKKMNYKIDLSNEDHCGPCGQYALEKTNKK